MKNRTFQLIYQSFFAAFAIVGTLGSLNFFDHQFRWDFYLQYTNVTNYLCAVIMAAELIQTARRKGDGYVTFRPCLKFVAMLGIVLTFLVFNLLLAHEPGRDPAENYSVGCVFQHVVLPLMFMSDWLLFYEHGKVKRSYPFLSTLLPLAYVVFLYFHAWLYHFDASIPGFTGKDPLIYPYFFLNPVSQGAAGVARWILILLAAFILMGFLFLGIDRLARRSGL